MVVASAAVDNPEDVEELIPVSAKFLSPLVWSKLFTGFDNFWYSIAVSYTHLRAHET